jgi:hypothetical protein
MVLGLKLTVTSVGWPVALNETAELKLMPAVVIVELPLLPAATETEADEAESVKLGSGATVSTTVAVCVTPPPVAVIVTG